MANSEFEKFMAHMLVSMAKWDKEMSIVPFEVKISVSPTSVNCECSGSKSFIEELDGGSEWFEETRKFIEPIMKQQTTRLVELMKKKYGFETKEAGMNDPFMAFLEYMASRNDD